MKKILSIIMCLLIVLGQSTEVKANSHKTIYKVSDKITTDLGNGFYMDIIIKEENINNRATSTKGGSKTLNYRNGDTVLWSATVYGTFTYNGSSSSCSKASASAVSSSSAWKIIEYNAQRNGSTAIANVQAKRYYLGIPVQTVNDEIRLSCSKSGVLS